eukprot:9396601-Pyramimonas_sp.AAC.1
MSTVPADRGLSSEQLVRIVCATKLFVPFFDCWGADVNETACCCQRLAHGRTMLRQKVSLAVYRAGVGRGQIHCLYHEVRVPGPT